jgi:hypothetical protein
MINNTTGLSKKRLNSNNKKLTPKAPIAAAGKTPKKPKFNPDNKKNATPKLAPELIPKTEGPAKGLRNIVWSERPETGSAIPTKIAAKTLGKRISKKTFKARVSLNNETGPINKLKKMRKKNKKTKKNILKRKGMNNLEKTMNFTRSNF